MEKDFSYWHVIKDRLQKKAISPTFGDREIWWCSIGINIGDEEDGKNQFFSRPVLVVRKFNKRIFWGVPLSTKIKETPHYYKIEISNQIQCVMLSQLKLFDSNRLSDKMGKINKEQFSDIRKALRALIP